MFLTLEVRCAIIATEIDVPFFDLPYKKGVRMIVHNKGFNMKLFIGLFIVALGSSAFASDATGTYTGKFDGRNGTLTLSNEANGYRLTFMGEDGSSDLIGNGCNSTIGSATEVKEKKGVLKSLAFEFSSGTCFQVEGRELYVKVKLNQLSLSLYSHTVEMKSCSFDHLGRQYCNINRWPVYADGKFTK